MADPDPNAFENALIADMRAHGGAVTTGPMAGETLLLMTSTGARSGSPRRAILNYSRDGDAYVVAGTAGGSPTDPAWVSNVGANPNVEVEVGNETHAATAQIADETDQARLWAQHIAAIPRFAAYPEQTGRVIPMVRLTLDGKR
jgi:deazaflavin-dependent oxidoreductase (nitroreductase family)